MVDGLDELECASIYVLREAYARVNPIALLWSVGKDSNALLWLARKAFFGRLPFPVVHLDTGMELPEVYEYRARLEADWNLNLIVALCPPEEAVDPTLPAASRAAARKSAGLLDLIVSHAFRGIVVGIRRDEQAMRSKERMFSPRSRDGSWDIKAQPPEFWDQYKTEFPEGVHVRIHPLLAWTELDIWHYTRREGIPVVPLYFARDGRRYRSLGERNITLPVDSTASTLDEVIDELERTKDAERAGRLMDHESEDAFERLRRAGYM
jgi:sulfate adenylyltransferase subunit 2